MVPLQEQQRETVLDQEAASKPKPEAGAKESSVKRDVAQQLQQLQQLQTTLGGKAEAKPVAQAAASLLKADAVDAAGASTTLADKGAAAATTATTNAFDVAEEEEDKEDDKDAAGEEEEEEEQEEYGAGGGQGSATSAAGGGARRLMAHADEEDAEALKTLLPLYNLSPSLTLAAMAAANAPLAHCLKKAIHEGDLSISPDAPQVSDEFVKSCLKKAAETVLTFDC